MSAFIWPDSGADHPGLVCVRLDTTGRVEWSNEAGPVVAGPAPTGSAPTGSAAAGGPALVDLVHPDDRSWVGDLLHTVSVRGRAAGIVRIPDTMSGSRRHFHMLLTRTSENSRGNPGFDLMLRAPVRDGETRTTGADGKILIQAWDVTCLVKQHEPEVHDFRDTLTGLANRRTFMTLLDHHLHASHRSSPPIAVLLAVVGDLNKINDEHRHPGKDHVLRELATRLRSQLRLDDTLARIGGDQFAVIIPNLTGWTEGEVLVERLRRAARAPITTSAADIRAELTIGLAFAEEATDGPGAAADLIALADGRMVTAGRADLPAEPRRIAP